MSRIVVQNCRSLSGNGGLCGDLLQILREYINLLKGLVNSHEVLTGYKKSNAFK